MSIGIRGFTIGYDFYAPERSVCFHHYAEGKNAKARNKGQSIESSTKNSFYILLHLILLSTISSALLGELKHVCWVRDASQLAVSLHGVILRI